MKKVIVSISPKYASWRAVLSGFFSFACQRHDWDIELVANERGQLGADAESRRRLRQADGFLSCGNQPESVWEYLSSEAAVVLVAATHDRLKKMPERVSFVDCDNQAIGSAGAQYLLSLGKFNGFGFVHSALSADDEVDSRERGFRDTLQRHDICCSTFTTSTPDAEIDRPELLKWLQALPKPAAVMAFFDEHAVNVLRVCHDNRISVPRQVAVLGVDDDELLCGLSKPTLSSLRPDHAAVGFAAGRELSALLGRPSRPGRVVDVPGVQVVNRESTTFISPAAHLVRLAKSYIGDHVAEGISVQDVADHVKVSRRLLDLRFREVEHKSVLQVINARRVSMAQGLLAKTRLPVCEIARRCGYRNARTLEIAFLRTLGQSPRLYRNSLLETSD